MTLSDIARLRLRQQSLDKPRFNEPRAAVAWLGAVQAQDYPATKFALGLRVKRATDTTIEAALDDGSILRTHVLRPTWHFVAPEDIRWMLDLSAPRVRKILAHHDRTLEITASLRARCNRVMAKALRDGTHLTREEIAQRLTRSRIEARGQRLARIVMHAELDGLICSGPRRGKQFTYALLEERVPPARPITREEARARLAMRYFASHGPAQLKDFAWWSGLTMKDAAEGLEAVKAGLCEKTLDDKSYWLVPARVPKLKSPAAHLLSIYDEYTIAYKDRSALGGGEFATQLLRMGNALTSVLVLDGEIVGTWKRVLRKDAVDVVVSPLRRLSPGEKTAVVAAADRLATFLGLPATVKMGR